MKEREVGKRKEERFVEPSVSNMLFGKDPKKGRYWNQD